MNHNQRVSHSDLSFYSSPEVTWPYPHQWLLLVTSISSDHTQSHGKKTRSQFSVKRCDTFIMNLLGFSNSLRFKYKIKALGIFFPFQTSICYSRKAQFDTHKIDAQWINLQLRPKHSKSRVIKMQQPQICE